LNAKIKFVLFPNSRNWFAISVLIVTSLLWFLGSFPLLQLPNFYLLVGTAWYIIGAFVFIKVGQKLMGSEIISVEENKITYRRVPFGFGRSFNKSTIREISLKRPYLTELEFNGANSSGISPWKLRFIYNNKTITIGRYLTKDQGEQILAQLSDFGYSVEIPAN
jgi:hypothetical protein